MTDIAFAEAMMAVKRLPKVLFASLRCIPRRYLKQQYGQNQRTFSRIRLEYANHPGSESMAGINADADAGFIFKPSIIAARCSNLNPKLLP